MLRLEYFYNYIIRPENLLKYNIFNIFNILSFKCLEIYIIFSDLINEEDLSLIHSFYILEFFSLQKPYIKKILIGSKKRKKSFFFVYKLTLRNHHLFNFLDYFLSCCLPLFKNRQIFLKDIFDFKGDFCFFFKDMNVFFKIPGQFLHFNQGFFFFFKIFGKFYERKNFKKFFKAV